ncbi:MAG: DNA alkylation repair protein [Clostridia bacterium]|nr:DNA alkylation repair protein [Clostridia bacterium]
MDKKLINRLFEIQDLKYRDFSHSLMPTVDKEKVIGVRAPALRKLAKELSKDERSKNFMSSLPHVYYEENNLHAFLIEQIKDFDTAISEIDRFLPYVDNWATCDCMSPKAFKKDLDRLLTKIDQWLSSSHTYTVRYGICTLMRYYLDSRFSPDFLKKVAEIRSDEYYVKMMIAWYFATALAKQYDATLPYISEKKLDKWTHNKAIQKAIESYRVTDEHKAYLKTLKIK